MSSLSPKQTLGQFSSSSDLSDIFTRHIFIRNVIEESTNSRRISSAPAIAPRHLLPPQEEEIIVRRSIKFITDELKRMEDYVTVTEDFLRRDRERDNDFYEREHRRKDFGQQQLQQNKENNSPVGGWSSAKELNKQPTYKINTSKFNRKILNYSPRDGRGRSVSGRSNARETALAADGSSPLDEAQAIIEYITHETNGAMKRMSAASNMTGLLSHASSASFDLDDEDIHNGSTFFDFDCSNMSDDKGPDGEIITRMIESDDGIEMTKLTLKGDIVEVEVNHFGDEEEQLYECCDGPIDQFGYENEVTNKLSNDAVPAKGEEMEAGASGHTMSNNSDIR